MSVGVWLRGGQRVEGGSAVCAVWLEMRGGITGALAVLDR